MDKNENELEAPTRREIEVINLLEEGCTNQEMAERLNVTLNTVEFHLKNIFQKLRVSTRLLAVKKSQDLNWTSLKKPRKRRGKGQKNKKKRSITLKTYGNQWGLSKKNRL